MAVAIPHKFEFGQGKFLSLQASLTYLPSDIYSVYGMTESVSLRMRVGDSLTNTVQFAITTIRHQPIVAGETDCHVANSVGKLHPIAEATLLKEDGSEAGVNEPGDLYVRSQTVALGYWNDEKATQET
jgi:acyl-CoA synthetase (AMP-forming)/AMP-acid ligase II